VARASAGRGAVLQEMAVVKREKNVGGKKTTKKTQIKRGKW
jgi:hypothetical protein